MFNEQNKPPMFSTVSGSTVRMGSFAPLILSLTPEVNERLQNKWYPRILLWIIGFFCRRLANYAHNYYGDEEDFR